jgi:hypothetical protein
MARSDIEALIADLVQDEGRLRGGAVARALDEAARRYSKDRPRVLVADCLSTGDCLLTPPADWEASSRIVALEWPVDAVPPSIRRPGDFVPYAHPTGAKLQCRAVQPPAAGETVRVTFTASHLLTDSDDTIPSEDRAAVAALAASALLEQLAVATAGDTDSTIPSDSVDHKTMSDRYAARARAVRKVYDDHLGALDAGGARPAGASAEVGLAGRTGLLRGRGV